MKGAKPQRAAAIVINPELDKYKGVPSSKLARANELLESAQFPEGMEKKKRKTTA